MKQSQWAIALAVLAGLVFIITFAMNYLGGGRQALSTVTRGPIGREVRFFWKTGPGIHGGLETERKTAGYHDFWFRNDNEETVKVGLERSSCKCTAVELFLLPERAPIILAAEAARLLAAGRLGTLHVWTLHAFTMPEVEKSAGTGHELLKGSEFAAVPGGAVGWVRMNWTGEVKGAQSLTASLWMDSKEGRDPIVLQSRLYFHEPIRVLSRLDVGLLREEELERGVTRDIICWSSTRPSLRLEVKTAGGRVNPASDPLEVGTPKPLSQAEVRELEKANNQGTPTGADNIFGRVLCAYRIPVTIRAVSRDGKTPFDLGPFARNVLISSPDIQGEPKEVGVRGRVRGFVEIGNEDEGGQLSFSTFLHSRGSRREKINLQSDVAGLIMQFDRARTPAFLDATLAKPETHGGRRTWELFVKVPPGKASGVFPRRDDPLYEDSAVYLKASVPGKPDRTIRIAVTGTANQG